MASFITIEGGDGTGKSTLLAKIESYFQTHSIPFLRTREPGGTPVAEEIREIILRKGEPGEEPISPMTELLLYEAARAEHVAKVIRPALDRGVNVLCDRFTTSSLAYQGIARGLGVELVRSLNDAATAGLEPDAVIWLKLSPIEARRRSQSRGAENRLDAEKDAFHEAVFRGFETLAAAEPGRFIVLDASKTPDGIFAELLAHPLWKTLVTGGNRR